MCHSLSRLQALILGVAVALGVGLSALALFAVGSQQWPLGDSFTVSVGFPNIRGVEQIWDGQTHRNVAPRPLTDKAHERL